MFHVQFKHTSDDSTWDDYGTFNHKDLALNMAIRIVSRHFATRIVDRNGKVIRCTCTVGELAA
jgi:hypothetical protein